MQADDLMAAVFPDAAACLENIPGDREVPDHPLVRQTVRDCLEEAMDLNGLIRVLTQIHAGELRCVSRDTPEPSVFSHEILNARPYAFVDDAPLEERRTQAVQTRRAGDRSGGDLGRLDQAAIARVRDEERPDPRDAGELHDVLLTVGVLLDEELSEWTGGGAGDLGALARTCAAEGRATRLSIADAVSLWVAAERLPELSAVHPNASCDPPIVAPPARAARPWTRDGALTELVRGRLGILGPVTKMGLATSLGVSEPDVESALLTLESEGAVLRGTFTPGERTLEWCDRRLLARIHRYTLNRLRAEISPVTPSEFMRFLFSWQHVERSSRLTGADGLKAVLTQLDGVELPARAWERHVLPARMESYDPAMLDMLCLTGTVGWARLSTGPTQVVGATPIALFLREHADEWFTLREPSESTPLEGHAVLDRLRAHGACFAHDLAAACDLKDEDLRSELRALVAAGAASSDGFAGLRAILNGTPARTSGRVRGVDQSGRWFELRPGVQGVDRGSAVETLAWGLLRRYGVVFRRLLAREASTVPWRELARVYRRLEARGEIRGGRFVSGMSGEQFATPEAVEHLRESRRAAPDHQLVTISGADPLNLTGVLTSDDRIRASTSTRIVYRHGVALAAMEGDVLRTLSVVEASIAQDVAAAAAGRRVPVVSGYVGRLG
jgi:ATP-dependent Lhr-like helicase